MTAMTILPSQKQLIWHQMEMGMFCHFSPNNFVGAELGDGKVPPSLFNPTELDCDQWVGTAKEAGFKYFILTAKHHDGFCLWPTSTTDYSIKASPWKCGKGDIVGECAAACRKSGIRFGVYISPIDFHEPCYHDESAYDEFYVTQLTELLSGYGDVFEVWFDGFGSQGRRYDWKRIMETVEKYQPEAIVFNMGKPSIIWVGNEDGFAPDPCWNRFEERKKTLLLDEEITWIPGTPAWLPSECDVSITRPNWFWKKENDNLLMSLDQLMEVYYKSVGHGANLLLNIPPDTRGLFPEAYAARALEFGAEIKKRFSDPVKEVAGKGNIIDLVFDRPTDFNHVQIMEDIKAGEKIEQYKIMIHNHEGWCETAGGYSVGHRKIHLFERLSANTVRLVVEKSCGEPVVSQLAAFNT
jgi:alpha-L-fucosidase